MEKTGERETSRTTIDIKRNIQSSPAFESVYLIASHKGNTTPQPWRKERGLHWRTWCWYSVEIYCWSSPPTGVWRYSILIKDSIHCSLQTYRTVNRFLMQDLTFASPRGPKMVISNLKGFNGQTEWRQAAATHAIPTFVILINCKPCGLWDSPLPSVLEWRQQMQEIWMSIKVTFYIEADTIW